MSIEAISFENGRSQKLAASIHRPIEESHRGVVVCHGMLSSRSSLKHEGLCRELSRRGLVALRFDFSGRGGSEGKTEEITYEGQIEDLLSALEVLRREVDVIGLVGSSMGGAVAILTASNTPWIRCVAGIATVGYPWEVLERVVERPMSDCEGQEHGFIEVSGQRIGGGLVRSSRETDIIGATRRLECPLLLVHGGLDEIVPIDQARDLAEASRYSRLEVIKGGDHMLHREEDQQRLEEVVGDFMSRHLA